MGLVESKPTFPTNEQWEVAKKTIEQRLDNMDKNLQKNIDEIKETQSNYVAEDFNELLISGLSLMEKCSDKSYINRVFYDNVECSQERRNFAQLISKQVADLDKRLNINNQLDKLNGLKATQKNDKFKVMWDL